MAGLYDKYRQQYEPALAAARGPQQTEEDRRRRQNAESQSKWMRLAGAAAPAVGSAVGMGVGAAAGGPVGAGLGGAIGGGLGQVASSLLGGVADEGTREFEEQDYQTAARQALLRDVLMGQLR